jgi:hypothetical protein
MKRKQYTKDSSILKKTAWEGRCGMGKEPEAGSNEPKNAGLYIEPLDPLFSVCKVTDYKGVDIELPYVFTGSTDQEKSLVCPVGAVPENTVRRDDGWKAFRIKGELDFSLTGILAGIAKVLADSHIGIFAISTYNTDYVLTKEKDFCAALKALETAGYLVVT